VVAAGRRLAVVDGDPTKNDYGMEESGHEGGVVTRLRALAAERSQKQQRG